MTDQTQAVVDKTDTPPVAGSEVESARKDVDDLDALLAEFDQQAKKPDTVSPPAPAPQPQTEVRAPDPDIAYIRQRFDRQDMVETINRVRGDLDPEVFDDDIVEGWLNAKAMKDHRLSVAYMQRASNPQAWAKVQAQLGKEFAKKGSRLVDREATDDRAAVAASMRGASSRAPEERPVDTSGMSNSEYRKYMRDNFGFDPGI